MFLDKLTARSFPLVLTAALAACGGAGDDTDETDDTTDTETDGGGDDTVDTSGGGADLFEFTGYSFTAQAGITAEGLASAFAIDGQVYGTALFVTLIDDEGTPSNTNDDTNCSLAYFPVTQQGYYSETDTETVPTFPDEDAAYLAWLEDQGFLSVFGIWEGNYEATEITDDNGDPCPFSEEWAGLAEEGADLFLADGEGNPQPVYVGLGEELSDEMVDLVEGASIDQAQKDEILAQWSSSYIRLPFEFTLGTDPATRNLEAISYGFAVNGDMEGELDGGELVPLESKDFAKGSDNLASPGIYIFEGRVTFATQ